MRHDSATVGDGAKEIWTEAANVILDAVEEAIGLKRKRERTRSVAALVGTLEHYGQHAISASERELVEALTEFLQAQFLPAFGDYSDFESATYTYEKSYGGGECSKHGRYYGSCASCRRDFERFQLRKDQEARRARNSALDEAANKARAALAKRGWQ